MRLGTYFYLAQGEIVQRNYLSPLKRGRDRMYVRTEARDS